TRPRRDAEAPQARIREPRVPARVKPGAEARQRGHGHVGRRVGLLADDADALHQRGAAAPDVVAEQLDGAGGGLLLAEKAADERRLAGAVAAEQRVDGAGADVEADAVDGGLAAV